MEVSTGLQLAEFFLALPLGLFVGFLYDIFRFFRLLFKNKILTAALDLLFWMIFTLLFFIFSIRFTSGEVRWYTLFGTALGIFLYLASFSISRLLMQIIHKLKIFANKLKKQKK